MSSEKLPSAAYAALEALQAQAGAVVAAIPGNAKKAGASGREALAAAQAKMAAHEAWVAKIVNALLKSKQGITVLDADAWWLESTFASPGADLPNRTVIFDPAGGASAPNTTAVEILLGGVGRLVFSDGTEQFVDDDTGPILIYSPRLKPQARSAGAVLRRKHGELRALSPGPRSPVGKFRTCAHGPILVAQQA